MLKRNYTERAKDFNCFIELKTLYAFIHFNVLLHSLLLNKQKKQSKYSCYTILFYLYSKNLYLLIPTNPQNMKNSPILSYVWLFITSIGCIGAGLTPFIEIPMAALSASYATLFVLAIYLFGVNRRRIKKFNHISKPVLIGETVATISLLIALSLNAEDLKNYIGKHESLFYWIIWGTFYISLLANLMLVWKSKKSDK